MAPEETPIKDRVNRRKFIAGVTAGTAAGLAGCSSSTNTTTSSTGNTGTTTQETDEPVHGGKPVLGMATEPDTLNPLATGSTYSLRIFENIYTFGTTIRPETSQIVPWGMKDWEVHPENVGTSSPTIVAELRDGLTFSDGEPVTAEDVQFTVEYIKEQDTAGTIASSQFSAVESVGVDSPDGTTVNYFLSEKGNAWSREIMGELILPKHIWKNVPDYSQYTPRDNGGPIGSGPFELTDYSWPSWFELELRDDVIWNTLDHADWLHDDGPFIDSLRVEVFSSKTALNQALLNGDVDQTMLTVSVDKGVEAQNNDMKVYRSQDSGWQEIGFNTRRVPLDCPAFRQLLARLYDWDYYIKELYKNIGAVKPDYATPPAFEEWRPPRPSEIDEYEGIPIPDLEFPGEVGTNNLDQAAIDEAREFLINHDRAKHDYSVGEATSGVTNTPDGQEIYVNGTPLTEAHTDNNGESLDSPLLMLYNPPSDQPKVAQAVMAWIDVLQKTGIPAEGQAIAFNSQVPRVFAQENFDMYEAGWGSSISALNLHYSPRFGEAGADLDGNSEATKFNPMGYTGTQDLVDQHKQIMEVEPRKPIVKKILANIWQDAPVLLQYHSNVIQPVTDAFTGHVQKVGGISNYHNWLNIRKTQE